MFVEKLNEINVKTIKSEAVENLEEVLKTFDYNKLSVKNSLTYDVLKCYLNMTERDAEYILYDEPMGLVSGVQTQLPVILSEYPFYEQSDVDTYLQLMKTTPEYFASLLKFEQKKSKAGLFMSDKNGRAGNSNSVRHFEIWEKIIICILRLQSGFGQ